MASRDPAFLWETEVLREARDRGVEPTREPLSHPEDWLTVNEAAEVTGIPPSTIRKWARHHGLPSFLEETSNGYLRMVSLQALRRRAEELGRGLPDPVPIRPEPPLGSTGPQPQSEVPEGTMLVPLDAWNRMLRQLGNLHEAGQQLAEARERAARAETEAGFLKERLAELRAQVEEARSAHSGETPVPVEETSVGLARRVYRAWRSNRRS